MTLSGGWLTPANSVWQREEEKEPQRQNSQSPGPVQTGEMQKHYKGAQENEEPHLLWLTLPSGRLKTSGEGTPGWLSQ